MYIKRIYRNVIRGGYIRSYQAAEMGYYEDFYNTTPLKDIVPYNATIPDEAERTYYPAAPSWYGKGDDKLEAEEEDDDDDDFDFDFSKFRRRGGNN